MELWDAYDKDLNKLGFNLVRGENVPNDVYHLVVEALIIHLDGSYLLMQRDYSKDVFPGVFESSVGGSALISENPQQAIKREMFEETGIDKILSIQAINKTIYDDSIFITYIVTTDYNKDKITLQKGETINYRWIDKESFIKYTQSSHNIPYQIQRLKPYLSNL